MPEPLTDAELDTLDWAKAGAWSREAKDRIIAQAKEANRLRAAIAEHHRQHADDRCWLDDAKLYEVAGLPEHDASVGEPEAMLANCRRFIEKRCMPGGGWKSYAELEAELAAVTAERDRLAFHARGTLANNICPDHRDKLAGRPCLECTIETLKRQLGTTAADRDDFARRLNATKTKYGQHPI